MGFVWGEQDGEVCFRSRRGRRQHHSHGLREIHGVRFGPQGMALVSLRRSSLPAARPHEQRDPLGCSNLYRASITCSPIRCMLALMPTASAVMNVMSMNKAACANGRVICPWPSGRCFFPIIIPGSSIGPPYQANQARIDANVHPQPHQAGGAVREGAALLQGLATCGKCGRHLHTHYRGQKRLARLSLLRQRYRPGTRRVLPQRRRHADRSSRGRRISEGVDAGGDRSYRNSRCSNWKPTTMPRSVNGAWR